LNKNIFKFYCLYCANKRRIYKLGLDYLRNCGARLFILEKTEHIYYINSFKLVLQFYNFIFLNKNYFLILLFILRK